MGINVEIEKSEIPFFKTAHIVCENLLDQHSVVLQVSTDETLAKGALKRRSLRVLA